MNEDRQIVAESHKIELNEDEIEPIDYLLLAWKYKYLILVGTFVCGLIVSIISLSMAKIYSLEMVLRPGILKVEEQGKNVYIDSLQNIKTLIESGIFNNGILNYLNDAKMDKVPKRLNFKVVIPEDSDIIRVKYETFDIKQGMVIQDHLSKLLLETYSKIVQYYKNEYDVKLSLLKNETDYIKTSIQSHKRSLKTIEKRIDELISEIELIKNNTAHLIAGTNKSLSKNPKENNILSIIILTNSIQQNLTLSNNYLNDYKLLKEEELQKQQYLEHELGTKLNEIKNVKFKKNNIQNIQILQSATKNPRPIKPRTKRNVILALVAGLFVMSFLAFVLEYVSKYNKK